MRILLDTHIVLWWLGNDPVLGTDLVATISEAEEAYVSAASVWELSIKHQLGKLEMPGDLRDQLIRHSFSMLPIHVDHALRYQDLPLLHRDPFDRMLVSQAQTEELVIVTKDPSLAQYDVAVFGA